MDLASLFDPASAAIVAGGTALATFLRCGAANCGLAIVALAQIGRLVAEMRGSDDVRDSPALDVAAALHRRGAVVVVHDPKAIDNARRRHPELTYVDSASEALRGSDAVLLLTHWPEYVSLDPEASGALVAQRHILDGRNVLDPTAWRAAGWTYRALGRP